jgi:sugar lactone lactonase YvrE
MRRGILAGMVAALLVAAAGSAAPAKSPNVSLTGRPAGLVAGRPWNAVLAVRGSRPSRVGLRATSGDRRIATSARQWRQGRYRGRLVFPAAGRWTLTARLGRKQFRLGTILVRARGPRPLVLFRPTELALDRDGSLLVVESGDNRVVRVDAGTGRISPLMKAAAPFGLAIAPSGELYVSSGSALLRFDAAGRSSTVAQMETDVGPVAVDAAGNVYFTTTTLIFRIRGGMGPVEHIAGTGEVGNGGDGGPAQAAQLDAPHGLVIAGGTLSLSDGGNDRIRRIDLASGIIAPVASIVGPAGLGLGADGSLLVCEQRANRVLRIHPSGASTVVAGTGRKASTGDGGPATAAALDTPTDVAVASDGTVYVLEGFASGRIRRIDPSGRITTVLRR